MKHLLFFIIFLSACSTFSDTIPTLPERTLRFDPLKPTTLYYQYFVCSSHFFGICTGHTLTRDTYDMTDPTVAAKIISTGFVVKVIEKP